MTLRSVAGLLRTVQTTLGSGNLTLRSMKTMVGSIDETLAIARERQRSEEMTVWKVSNELSCLLRTRKSGVQLPSNGRTVVSTETSRQYTLSQSPVGMPACRRQVRVDP